MWRHGPPTAQEALQFMLIYLSLTEPDRRQELLALAQKFARETNGPLVQDNEQK